MKKLQDKTTYFFVDESGDPYFYDRKGNFIVGKEGCSKILILGFIKTETPEIIRSRLNGLKTSILFQNQLHSSKKNVIYFAVRTNRARQMPLEDSIHKAILTFENKWNTKIDSDVDIFPQRLDGEPCLQVTDYMNWAIQRLFVKREVRYFEFIRRKVSLIADIYDFNKYPKNYYNRKNVLDLNKISPL